MQAEAWRTHAGFAVPETRPRWRSLTPGKSSVRLGLAASPAVALDIHVRAEVAELADAHGSGPCTRKGVGVRVPSSAPIALFSIAYCGNDILDAGENHA